MSVRFVQSLAWLVIAAAVCLAAIFAQRAEAAEPIAPGQSVTYTDAAGGEWCATVQSIAPGAGAVPWAWLILNANRLCVVHEPVSALRAGCAS